MRIMLTPESLGSMTFHVEVNDGKMNAVILLAHPEARAVVEANLPQLKQALSQQGIEVQRIDVLAAAQSSMKESMQQRSPNAKQRTRRREAAAETATAGVADKYESTTRRGYSTIELIM
jgi:flagellar hook-length control protein FliK